MRAMKRVCRGGLASRQFRMEAVENRLLASTSTWSSSSISDIFGYVNGVVLFGDNGDEWGYATGSAGIGINADVVQFNVWDVDPSDGIDSNSRNFSFCVNSSNNGQATLTCDGAQSGSFSVGSAGSFSSVTIRAAVTGAYMRMAWTNVSVTFFNNGQAAETFSSYDVIADRLNSSNNSPLESGLTINANGSGYNGVQITAQVRIQAAQGVYPGSNDIFGDIAIS